MTVEGIDVSTFQATTPPLAGLGFVFARASYGTSLDARYAMHAGNVRAAGLVLGAYHYWADTSGLVQATTFLGVASGADLLAIDLEGSGSGTDTAHAEVRDFIAAVHAKGRLVGLYHSLSGYPALGQDFDWVAAWGSTAPSIGWEFWQYQGSPLDRDRWHGDLASLASLAQGKPGGTMATYELTTQPGTVKVSSGITAHGIMPGDSSWTQVKTAPGPFTAHTDQLLHRIGGTMLPTYAAHMTDGPLAGLWLGTGTGIAYTADPAPAPCTQADLDAAKAAGFDAAKTAAIAAVQSI